MAQLSRGATSFPYLQQFVWRLRRIWIRVLRRRSEKDRFSWGWMLAITNKLWPTLRIVYPWPTTRFAVSQTPKVGAVCVNAYVRICAGGAGQPAFLPRYVVAARMKQSVVMWGTPGATGMLQLRASLKSRRFSNDHEALRPCSLSPLHRRPNAWLPEPSR